MPPTHSVLVICNGLRADLLISTQTPNIWAFFDYATRFADHYSVFPSVTRVCSSSIATGYYPAHHGLLGNGAGAEMGLDGHPLPIFPSPSH